MKRDPHQAFGKSVLESFGGVNWEMVLTARDRYWNAFDVSDRLVKDGNEEVSERRIASVFGQSVFHKSGQIEGDGLMDEDIVVELGDGWIEDTEELKKCLVEVIKTACLERVGKS